MRRVQSEPITHTSLRLGKGPADVADVDTAISAGPGLRWALMGPHLTFHLAGGVGGIATSSRHRWQSGGRAWAIRY